MLNTLRNDSIRATGLKAALAVLLLAGNGAATAASVTVDLCATTGTTTGTAIAPPLPVWGYASGACPALVPVSAPGGPVISVSVGDVVTVNLHNGLTATTGLFFQGQAMVPDTTGVAGGGTKVYSFVATNPGTFLYQAAPLANAEHQVAMGFYGALVVHPTTAGQAYDDVSTAFNDEAVLVLSEIDPALNNKANKATFDMRNYAPKYFLINGKAYPDTAAIGSTAGNKLLLRYVNAGAKHHSMGTLGLRQNFIAKDGAQLPTAADSVTADTLAAGQTGDALINVPAAGKFSVYDASLDLRNSNAAGFGGMLTFVDAGASSEPAGPVTSAVALAPSATNGSAPVTLNATITGGATDAEYFVDAVGADGLGCPTTSATSISEIIPVSGATAPCADLTTLSSGNHSFYVHGFDGTNWGAVSSAAFKLDKTGPLSTSLLLTPSATNGTVNVALSATGNDSASGNSNVVAAEYAIDAGVAVPMNVAVSAPVASLTATIPAATVFALADGTHAVTVRSQDSFLNWGSAASVNLVVNKAGGPVSTISSVLPNPSNGLIPFNASNAVVRIAAGFTSASSNLAAAEFFIDTVGANGSGVPFISNDGNFNSASETGFGDIPLGTVRLMTNGVHTIYAHAKNAAGNWGATGTATLTVDTIAPAIVSINRLDADPTTAASVHFLVTFSEPVKGVTSANFALAGGSGSVSGATVTQVTPVTGSSTTWTVTTSTGTGGGGTIGLNLASATGIADVAGNVLPTLGLPFVGQSYTQPSPPLYFSTSGNTNPPGVGGTADDADIYFWSGAAFSRVIDASGTGSLGLPGGANVDGFDRVDATHFYMSFDGAVDPPGPLGSVADEDVVFYNAGTWSLFFDGSAGGNGIAGTDLDAISIVGSTLFFSTDNNNAMPGTTGGGDDADIYRWNGPASNPRYTRVFDGTTHGLPGGADIDGLTVLQVDGAGNITRMYVSFNGDVTIGSLTVQDEDVVEYNNGVWSVYFNGTARSLTNGNLDIDAFDLP